MVHRTSVFMFDADPLNVLFDHFSSFCFFCLFVTVDFLCSHHRPVKGQKVTTNVSVFVYFVLQCICTLSNFVLGAFACCAFCFFLLLNSFAFFICCCVFFSMVLRFDF